MWRHIWQKAKAKKGSAHIDTLGGLFIILAAFVVIITVFPVFVRYQQLNTMCQKHIMYIESTGKIDDETNAYFEKQKVNTGLDVSIEYDATYISGTKKLQLETDFLVTMRMKIPIGVLKYGVLDIPIKIRGVGRSEVYWKN